MTLPRILHRIYAHVRGYRWKPCPICKREFGAHEAATVLLYVSPGNSESVCHWCESLVRMLAFESQLHVRTFAMGGIDLPEVP